MDSHCGPIFGPEAKTPPGGGVCKLLILLIFLVPLI